MSLQPQKAAEQVATPRLAERLDALFRIPALVALFSVAAVFQAGRISALQDTDIWWHLRTGLWILQNRAIPHQGIYSQQASSVWVASSWLYDLAVAIGYNWIGLQIFPLLAMAFSVALGIVTFLLARGQTGKFWIALALSSIAQYTIALSPTPEAFSILLFGVELWLLFRSRRTGNLRPLFWLPVVFFFWANLHPQFLLGLVLLLLFVIVAGVERWLSHCEFQWAAGSRLSFASLSGIFGLSLLAILLNPEFIHLLPAAATSTYNRVLFEYFGNMSALRFRSPQDFVVLLLSMLAFVVLGRTRTVDLFKIALMAAAILVSLRIQRDSWIVVLVAIGVIGDSLSQLRFAGTQSRRTRPLWVAALVAIVFFLVAIRLPGNQVLIRQVYSVFPAKACDFIRANQLPRPLFNAYSWGGFLTWYMPEYPVAVDGRMALYGDKFNESYLKVSDGTERMEKNPTFARAQTLLLQRQSGMAKALTTIPALQAQFRVAYQDDLSVVLVRQR